MLWTRRVIHSILGVLAVIAVSFMPGVARAADLAPPELVAVTVAPTTIDVSAGAASVTLTMEITDDLSGFNSGYCRFYPLGGGPMVAVGFYSSNLVAPDTYEMTLTFPQFSKAGEWTLQVVNIQDVTTNKRYYNAVELTDLGFSAPIVVISNEDTVAPELVSIEITPTSIDVSDEQGQLTLTTEITDNLSGFRNAQFYLYSPSSQQYKAVYLQNSTLTSQDTYQSTFTLPRYSEAGDWTMNFISLYDKAGVRRQYPATQLSWIPPVTIISDPQDIQAPEIQSFDFSPKVVNTILSPDSSKFTVHVKDPLSGLTQGNFHVKSPSGGQRHYMNFSAHPYYFKSGDANDGIYEITKEFPRYSEYGEWVIDHFYLRDLTSNTVTHNDDDLKNAGFPVTILMEGAVPGGSGNYTISPDGGTLQLGDGELTMDFPEGAVSEDTDITVTEVGRFDPVNIIISSGVHGLGLVVKEYNFEPDGLEFDQPVTVTITIDITGEPSGLSDRLDMYLYDAALDAFVSIGAEAQIVENADGTTNMVFTALLYHFSDYAVIERLVDDSDITPPAVHIVTPGEDESVQDQVTLVTEATDLSTVSATYFTLREDDGSEGINIGYEGIPAIQTAGTDLWGLDVDTTLLPDGNYVIFATATDEFDNTGISEIVHFTIRNWTTLALLPPSKVYRAGRTMPIKFSVRVDASVDPSTPFVRNEDLEVRIFEAAAPESILQTSAFGDTSTDYRINSDTKLYITNFKTSKKSAEYTVEIWRSANDFLVDHFTFETKRK